MNDASGAVEIVQSDRSKRIAAAIGLVAWFAILTSLARSLFRADGAADAVWELVIFSGFFTIWTNTAIALALTIPLLSPQSKPGQFFRRSGVITGLAASIALVALVYELLLRGSWHSPGLDLLLDLLVHYLIPVAFVGYWWLVTPRAGLNWRGPLYWLSYPAGYTVFALVRGELLDTYPYPFLDVSEFGLDGVLLSIAGIGGVFLVLSYILVAAGRLGK